MNCGDCLSIDLLSDSGSPINIKIAPFAEDTLFEVSEKIANENGEARYQLVEAAQYEYELDAGFELELIDGVVEPSRFEANHGRLKPKQYVGTLPLNILDDGKKRVAVLKLEVRSRKADYRTHYRNMLAEIADFCIDLIFKSSSPSFHLFEVDSAKQSENLYQQFAFMQSELSSKLFKEALPRLMASPTTQWRREEEELDSRRLKRIRPRELRQFAAASNRVPLSGCGFRSAELNLESVPIKIFSERKTEDRNTSENQFVKYVLGAFLELAVTVARKNGVPEKIRIEAEEIRRRLEEVLGSTFFTGIENPKALHLNSPALHRKGGYRDVVRSWLSFSLAAKLSWSGLGEVYSLNKRDVATLYEYWCFFAILGIVQDVFKLGSSAGFISKSSDGFDVLLKRESESVVSGIYESPDGDLNVKLSFNRTFKGRKGFPQGGSWTKQMRPDITLTLWPKGMSEDDAEIAEEIVHIHFDAKYKLDRVARLFDDESFDDDDASDAEMPLSNGYSRVKRIDLMTMHAYRDAIRRTSGAYVLYPGDSSAPNRFKTFHEVLPGLGAFALQPGGPEPQRHAIKKFLEEVVSHFQNSNSHERRIASARRDSKLL